MYKYILLSLIGLSIISYGVSTDSQLLMEPYEHNFTHCELCEFLVQGIEREDKKINATIQSIAAFINAVCHMVGGPIGNECQFIIKNISHILSWISEGFTSKEICEKLHFCNTTLEDINFVML